MPDFPKILLVAQNASSLFGGEAFLPLHYYRVLKERGYPVSLIAHRRNYKNLQDFFKGDLQDIHFIEDTIWHRSIWKIGKVFPGRLGEMVFSNLLNTVNELFQRKLVRELVAKGRADIIHQPIPVSPLAPSWMFGFGVPVIIGPMNGGMIYPKGYEDYESRSARLFVRFARQVARGLNRIISGKRRAAALLVANKRTENALPLDDHPNVITLVENGVDLSTWAPVERKTRDLNQPFRLVFMGRLVGWKAIEITLEAIAVAKSRGADVVLDILGDGTERKSLEALRDTLCLTSDVTFHGFKPQTECSSYLNQADALILNSIWECGGAVVLEAMSLGLPVIGPDWGGPADYLDPSCGILVHPEPRENFAERLADAIISLAEDPNRCRSMGQAGVQKIRAQFDWQRKVDRIIEIYESVVTSKSSH